MKPIRIVIPKGSIFKSIFQLLSDAGIELEVNERSYKAFVNDSEMQIKIMRPQDIPNLIELGSHDAGFTGYDWVIERNANVSEVLDLGLDPVKIVAAVEKSLIGKNLHKRKIVVASEYENITKRFLTKEGYDYVFIHTYGATEAFPPDDADMIIDNTATGKTLKEHNLRIVKIVLESTTRFIANNDALKNRKKKEKILEIKMLLKAVLDARQRVMLEMNVPKDKLNEIVKALPCMRSPTISPLFGKLGYGVKAAVERNRVPKLIPVLKKIGATDILEYEFRKVVL